MTRASHERTTRQLFVGLGRANISPLYCFASQYGRRCQSVTFRHSRQGRAVLFVLLLRLRGTRSVLEPAKAHAGSRSVGSIFMRLIDTLHALLIGFMLSSCGSNHNSSNQTPPDAGHTGGTTSISNCDPGCDYVCEVTSGCDCVCASGTGGTTG